MLTDISGDCTDMWPSRGHTNGARPGISRLADGGGLETGFIHALHRPGSSHAATFRHYCTTRLLRCQARAIYQVSLLIPISYNYKNAGMFDV